jgi:anthranilate phosphoribosyltransferase
VGLTLEQLGGWPTVLGKLARRDDLTADEAGALLADILDGNATATQIAAFAIALKVKDITVEELTGLVQTLLHFATPVVIDAPALDTCGSGGAPSRKISAFNVSTISSFVIAGAGVKVCKHGGRAASATSSSGDLLEELGVVIDLGPEGVARCIDEVGMGFCFAPRFHPAMRHAAPVRRELGVPTIFNFIAPLANPGRPTYHVMGVSDPAMAEKMLGVLAANGVKRALVVYGHDGLDEMTTTGPTTVLDLDGGDTRTYTVDPRDLGLKAASAEALRGGDAKANGELARRVLGGEPGAHRDIVLLNAAAGLVAAGVTDDLAGGLERAATSIDSGAAAGVLERLVALSQTAAG